MTSHNRITELEAENRRLKAEALAMRACRVAGVLDTYLDAACALVADELLKDLATAGSFELAKVTAIALRSSHPAMFENKPTAPYRGPNPWKRGTLNLTEQARILKENPELAKSLKAEAGMR